LEAAVTRGSALLVAAGLGVVAATSSDARACAEVFGRDVGESERRPSLAYEQTLILYDAEKRREHFIREVVFSEAREPFGFVVPTPARPEVAKLQKSPFAKLRESFDFYAPERVVRLADADSDASSVKVLEVSKVGRFTAFVLSASDAAGLSSWLSQNGFVNTPATDVWLAHYVKLRFFYVAMRYEPSAGAKGKTTAETVRISFDSPLPYYPYLEPDAPIGKGPARPRLLEIWLVSTRDFVPVSPRSREKADWVRPFLNGARYTSSGFVPPSPPPWRRRCCHPADCGSSGSRIRSDLESGSATSSSSPQAPTTAAPRPRRSTRSRRPSIPPTRDRRRRPPIS
jgi:hypothetical protein